MFSFKFDNLHRLEGSTAQGVRLILPLLRLSPGPATGTILLMLLAGLGEGLGLSFFAPLLGAAGLGGDDRFSQSIFEIFRELGLEPTVSLLLILIAVLFVAKGLIQFWAMLASGYAGTSFATSLRVRVVTVSLQARWALFTEQPIGLIANSIASDTGRAGAAVTAAFQVATFALHVAIYFAVSLFVSWEGTLAAVAGGMLLFSAMHYFVGATKRAGQLQQKTFERLISRLIDQFGMVKPIKAMGAEARLLPYLTGDIMGVDRAARQLMHSKASLTTLNEPIIMGLLCVGAWLGMAVLGLALPDLLVLAMIFYRAAGRITALQSAYQNLISSEASLIALLRLLEQTERMAEVSTGSRQPILTRSIDLQHVRFGYGAKDVLEDVSLTIPAHRITALVGPSGSGKTTILDLVLGLHVPDAGHVLIDGVDLREIDRQRWRARIGYVPQETFLLNDTLLANVTLNDPAISRERVAAALHAAAATDFVEAMPLGMDSNVGERGMQLSGGQRQRVALARALVRDPLLVVLDEPTSALDPVSAETFLDTLRNLSAALTVLIVSHQPEVTRLADVVYTVAAGRVDIRTASAGAGSRPVLTAER